MSDPIIGTPEGREGIWLIDAEQAITLVKSVKEKTIHNYLNSANLPMTVGATWGKAEVLALLICPGVRIGLMFAPDDDINHHQLVVIDDARGKRWSFDVGVIPESRMKKRAAK